MRWRYCGRVVHFGAAALALTVVALGAPAAAQAGSLAIVGAHPVALLTTSRYPNCEGMVRSIVAKVEKAEKHHFEAVLKSAAAPYMAHWGELPTQARGARSVSALGRLVASSDSSGTVRTAMEAACRYATVGGVVQVVETGLFVLPSGAVLTAKEPPARGLVTVKVLNHRGLRDTIELVEAGAVVGTYDVEETGGRFYVSGVVTV